jgi:hypothetical protein
MIDWQSFWGNVVGCFASAPWPVQCLVVMALVFAAVALMKGIDL